MKPPFRKNKWQHRSSRGGRRRSAQTRAAIMACLILLAIYALMQLFLPQWTDYISDTQRTAPPPELTGSQIGSQTAKRSGSLTSNGRGLRILDGDTIEINGHRIRFKGMDAPETKQLCQLRGKDYACGVKSTETLKQLIGNRTVTCRSDGYDRYKRILGFCTAGDTDLNRALVEQGWAVSYGMYQREEARARKAKLGMWAGEFERPAQWRRQNSAHDTRQDNGRSRND